MIADTLLNSYLYEGISGAFKKAFDYLKKTDFSEMTGEYEIEGRDIFAIMNRYNTRAESEGRLEAHRKYIDLQYLFRGGEKIGFVPLENQKISEEYDEKRDVAFYEGSGSFTAIKQGMFGIYFPSDLHMPCIGDGSPIIKVVVKIRVGI